MMEKRRRRRESHNAGKTKLKYFYNYHKSRNSHDFLYKSKDGGGIISMIESRNFVVCYLKRHWKTLRLDPITNQTRASY
jgi:hypothetical protein